MQTQVDKRYRILVTLKRDDRPRYWDFHCPQCRTKVGELSGKKFIAMDDVADMYGKNTTGVLCPGAYKRLCDIWYYFEELS